MLRSGPDEAQTIVVLGLVTSCALVPGAK